MANRSSRPPKPDDRARRPRPPGLADPASRRADAAHFGRFGEATAARWYRRAGYRILARNWHCREGELDLVVARGGAVTFVEVKARADDRFGTGGEAVGFRKQRRVRTAASRWLDQAGDYIAEIHFDVVEVDRQGRLQRHQDCF